MRKAGILLPISALPSRYGIGTLGAEAHRFVDWLYEAGMKIWQVLPLLPTGYGDSPYQSCASDALNYYFIDLDQLQQEGLLLRGEYEKLDWGEPSRVDYGKLFRLRVGVLRKAFERFDKRDGEWQAFLAAGRYADFGTFMSLKSRFSYRPWTEWGEFREYDGERVERYVAENREDVEFWQFTQFLFLRQWRKLKEHARERKVEIMGDMPIYVAADSVEAWKYRREMFLTDSDGNFSLVAGVPPDAFSETGQLWGNPVYDWDKMKKTGYRWWRNRIDYAFELFDIVRIDHFRGFDRFYAVPAGAETAKYGEWMDGPGYDLFEKIGKRRIVAEDLGIIDDGVRELMRKTGYPGMKVLEFAFDGNPQNGYKPTKYGTDHCVAYTGTHDNLPLKAFIERLSGDNRRAFERDMREECKALGVPYRGGSAGAECRTAVRLLFSSRADTVIVPMNDALVLGGESRINYPSTLSQENWSFRFSPRDFIGRTGAWLKGLALRYDR